MLIGAAAWFGLYKMWYWQDQYMIYAFIPIGILFFLAGGEIEITDYLGSRILFLVFVLTEIILSILLYIYRPNFIKAKWIKIVERQPEKILKKMRIQALSLKINWKEFVKNEKSIMEWADRIKRKK